MSNRKISYGLFKHWIPDLRQTKNKNAYVARQCPICDMEGTTHSKKAFRLNLKLRVFKCYMCGMGGVNDKTFIKYIKDFKKMGHRLNPIEMFMGCQNEIDSDLPF